MQDFHRTYSMIEGTHEDDIDVAASVLAPVKEEEEGDSDNENQIKSWERKRIKRNHKMWLKLIN